MHNLKRLELKQDRSVMLAQKGNFFPIVVFYMVGA
jgi:hypothetical protein